LIVPIWLAAMSWLVWHDIWPRLTAGAPPKLQATEWLKSEGRESQYAILLGTERLGTIWTTYRIDEWSIRREDWIWLDELPIGLAPVRLFIESLFTGEGDLDEFTVRLESPDAVSELHGERFHADFSFSLEGMVGGRRLNTTTFKTPLIDGGFLSGAFNPFSQLSGLQVGQTWRMQAFNPLAALTGVGNRFIPMLVRVTGEETIAGPEGAVRCFVVEAPRAMAWVDAKGVVRVQEVDLPMVGRIRVVRETEFDRDTLTRISRQAIYFDGRHRP